MPTLILPTVEAQQGDGGSPVEKQRSRFSLAISVVVFSIVLVASCCSGGQNVKGNHDGGWWFSHVKKSTSSAVTATSDNRGFEGAMNPPNIGTIGSSNASVAEERREKEDTNSRQLAGKTVVDTMLAEFEKARKQMWNALKEDWGADVAPKMFKTEDGQSRGRSAFVSPDAGPGWDRLKRKIMKKVLQGILRQDSSTGGESSLLPFIWATGGHSAAAGHGNFYNQSYTAVMERFAAPVFAAAGLEFVGRNYAMGGTPSGAELSSCTKEVFGLDTDVLSWDFGMTDGDAYVKMEHYFYRALKFMPNFPAVVGIHVAQEREWKDGMVSVLKEMQNRGAAVLYLVDEQEMETRAAIPDSMDPDVDTKTLAPYVKYLRCESQIESGDVCNDQKFQDYICEDRRFKTSWHPGWKIHALNGVLNALTLVELLHDALHEISEKGPDWNAILDFIKAQEKTQHDQFFNNHDLPMYSENVFFQLEKQNGLLPEKLRDIDVRTLFEKPNLCHTARLPAEIRHLGCLTESKKIGFTEFDMGLNIADAKETPNDSEFMRLAYDSDSRQECPRVIQMDFKDFFFVHEKEGWKKLVLPNDAEIKYYGKHSWEGLIAICLGGCPWSDCEGGEIDFVAFDEGKGQIEVNGKLVKELTPFMDNGCQFLRHAEGHIFPPNSDGRFEIKARAVAPNHFLKFMSFIIW